VQRIPNERLRNKLGAVEELSEEKIDATVNKFLYDFKGNALEANGWGMMLPAYSIFKASLNAYTRVLAKKNPDMLINCVHPGFVSTDLNWHKGTMTVDQGVLEDQSCWTFYQMKALQVAILIALNLRDKS
jgi:(+)-neomenthol dehydrogenase